MTASSVPPLTVDHVTKTYASRVRGRGSFHACEDVSFEITPGAAVSLVGASGSGKSTLAKIITGVEHPSSGSIRFGDVGVGKLRGKALRSYRSDVQMVFQDPYGALNPLHTVEYMVGRPLQNFLKMPAARARDRITELLETVGLAPAGQFLGKLPHQLSGGQRQRVVIARALAADPKLIVADEPASMLDVSLRAGVLDLLVKLRVDHGLSLLYITHDLLSARVVTDEILVLHEGKLVERGNTKRVLQNPQDAYTVQLLDAIPNPFAAGDAAPPASTAADDGR
ncbi:ABC transporter ATP-binding protein [Nakamurella lactea]|uniref:ABC transporter ATP-binding protein n=1 Tax=Nakamurella lactea TaxID=459515 RepID=UPI00042A741A|nr:ATP-binding cassette domain-containing protein [Nakamurella lactea]